MDVTLIEFSPTGGTGKAARALAIKGECAKPKAVELFLEP